MSVYNDTNWVIYTGKNSPMTYGNIRAIEMDRNNVKWIASEGGGLIKFNDIDSTWGNYFNPGFLTCLIIDSSQNKWFGSPGGGLFKFEGDSVLINFRPENSPLPAHGVLSLAIDSNQNLWIGTSNGLAIYNENGIVGISNQNIIHYPKSFILYQNYPNPFNPYTTIKYQLNKTSNVNLSIFNIKGQLVKNLVSERQPIGNYEVAFNGNNLPSGTYFYTLNTDNYNETRKMILLK